jgi:hypothetical protein
MDRFSESSPLDLRPFNWRREGPDFDPFFTEALPCEVGPYSQFITLIQFDFGMDQQTGVHDRGEIFECRECKKVSTPEEVEAEDIRSFEQAMTAACVLARSAEVIGLQIALRMQEAAGPGVAGIAGLVPGRGSV